MYALRICKNAQRSGLKLSDRTTEAYNAGSFGEKQTTMKTTFLAFCMAALTSLLALGQSTQLSPAQLREDFTVFKSALTEAHPGLYRYTDTISFQHLFDSVSVSLNQAMSEQAFYQSLVPIMTKIRCGHTKLHPDGKWATRYHYGDTRLFPWQLYLIEQKAYVLNSYTGNLSVEQGTEVTSINGKAMDEIIEQLSAKIFVDGYNQSTKNIELNKGFAAYYANFIGSPESFEITCRLADGTTSQVNVPAATLAQIEEFEKRQETSTEPTFQLRFLENNIAFMRIKVFYPAQKGDDFQKFLQHSFAEINKRKSQHLIIDLRNNEGGQDRWGADLYAYLTDKKFRYYDRLEMTPIHRYSFDQYASKPKFYGLLTKLIKKPAKGPHLWTHHKNLKLQKPASDPYSGKVYVLTNGLSFSVTSEFATAAHVNKRATFVGQEVGGGYYGNNSGTFLIVKLPHSKLIVGIPMLAYYMAVSDKSYPAGGVLPDYPVTPSIEDVLNRKDVELETALKLIQQSAQATNKN